MCITLPIVMGTHGVQELASKYHLREMARLGQGSYKMSMEYPMVPESKKSAQRIWGKVRKKQKFE